MEQTTLTLLVRDTKNKEKLREIEIPNAKKYDPTGKETDKDTFFNNDDLQKFAKALGDICVSVTPENGASKYYVNDVYGIKRKSVDTTVVKASN